MDSTRVAIEYTLQGDRPVVVANPGRAKDAKIAADYDYFVYLYCGVLGPSPSWSNRSLDQRFSARAP